MMNLKDGQLDVLASISHSDENTPSELDNSTEEKDNRVITIFPGSAQENSVRFFDVLHYPLEVGDNLSWFNSDYVNHQILLINSSGKSIGSEETTISHDSNNDLELLADSGIIKPKTSFNYTFTESGVYSFLSSLYPWMTEGFVIVADAAVDTGNNNLLRGKITDLENNNIDIEISQYPSNPKVGDTVYWIISFYDNISGQNQEHVDFEFSVHDNTTGEAAFSEKVHSSYGTEESAHILNKSGSYISQVEITHILFRPVYPDIANFTSFRVR